MYRVINNKKGFTLIELLGVIAIIAIIFTIAIVGFNRYVDSTREKANDISIESIKKSAVSYITENDTYWVKIEDNDLEYSCVPVLELVNKGYLKNDDIKDINWKTVKVNRYFSNKTIFLEENGDGFCSFESSDEKEIMLYTTKVTTSSIEVNADCKPIDKVGGYLYALGSNSYGEKINNDSYRFYNLTSGKTYNVKAKCNYTDGIWIEAIKDSIKVGTTDIKFGLSNIETDNSLNKIYKTATITFSSEDVTSPSYYFKVNSSGNVSDKTVMSCGNGNSPSDCEEYSGVLEKDYWYKLKEGNKVNLKIYGSSSSIVYARVWDGERYSTNKSVQVTFPSNPYVVVNVSHSNYNDINNSYYGTNTEVLEYNVGNWLNNPKITWTVYGGYETESYVYYSNNTKSITTRNNYNENYKFDSTNSTISTDDFGGTLSGIKIDGLQEIGIKIVDKKTNKQTIVRVWVDLDLELPTVSDIDGGTTLKVASQNLTLKCSDTVGVTAYYFGTTKPTVSSATTTIAADLTSLQGSDGLSKTVTDSGTYWLGCKDAAGNFAKKSIVIRKYVVNNLLETIAGTTGTYKSSNYASASTETYIVKDGTTLTLASIYTVPTGSASEKFEGYSTSYGTTAAIPSTTAPTIATNNTTTYYMWFNRNTYTVTVSKPTNGTVKAETVTKTGNSVTASSGSKTLTVKYGDTVKATATASTGYSFDEWSGGYVSGTTNPVTGAAVTTAKTIMASFKANTYNISYTYNGGSKGTYAPSSGTYNSVATISNPSKTFTVNVTNSASGTLSATSASTIQTFAGWTYSDGNTSTAKYGTSSSAVTTLWSTATTKVTEQYFKNLRSTSGIVTMTANWTAVAVTLPTVTKTGYTCGYTATSGGTSITYSSGGIYTPSTTTSSATLYTVCVDNVAPTVTIRLSGAASSSITKTGGSGTITYNSGNWTNATPTVSWSVSDASTATLTSYYNDADNYGSMTSYSTSNINVGPTTNTSGSFKIRSGGQRQMGIVVEDTAGNTTTVVINAYLDYIAPSAPTNAEISGTKLVLTGSSDGQSGLKNDRISFYGPIDKHYYSSTIALSDFTTVGSYWFGTSSDDNAGNNGTENAISGTLVVSDKVSSEWYSCSSGNVSGSICKNYNNVTSSTFCNTCSYYSNDCTCARLNRANCPSKCRKSYYTAGSCTSAGYLWNSEGYCWSYYANNANCNACGSTTTYSCPTGWQYNSTYGYCWKYATYNSDTSCESGYTEVSGKCYKLS